jgi:hypothetical protein
MDHDDAAAKKREKREQRFIAMIGRLGSTHAGEGINALQKVTPEELGKFGLTSWTDVGVALVQRFKLLEAAQELAQERDALRSEVERLRHNASAHGGGSLGQALWQDTSLPSSIENRHAQWLLDLAGQGCIHLTAKEAGFVQRCAGWRGRLTPNQRPWLEDLLRQTIARTGQAPPP